MDKIDSSWDINQNINTLPLGDWVEIDNCFGGVPVAFERETSERLFEIRAMLSTALSDNRQKHIDVYVWPNDYEAINLSELPLVAIAETIADTLEITIALPENDNLFELSGTIFEWVSLLVKPLKSNKYDIAGYKAGSMNILGKLLFAISLTCQKVK